MPCWLVCEKGRFLSSDFLNFSRCFLKYFTDEDEFCVCAFKKLVKFEEALTFEVTFDKV